jgi:hypothetical protein
MAHYQYPEKEFELFKLVLDKVGIGLLIGRLQESLSLVIYESVRWSFN